MAETEACLLYHRVRAQEFLDTRREAGGMSIKPLVCGLSIGVKGTISPTLRSRWNGQ